MQEGRFKIFLCDPRDGSVLLRSLDLPRAAKKNVPWKLGVGAVWNLWSQADLFFYVRGRGVRSITIFYVNNDNLYF